MSMTSELPVGLSPYGNEHLSGPHGPHGPGRRMPSVRVSDPLELPAAPDPAIAPPPALVVASRQLTAEEEYLVQRAQRSPIEAAARLQDAAKLLLATVAGTSGLLACTVFVLSTLHLLPSTALLAAAATQTLWAASIFCLLSVLRERPLALPFCRIGALKAVMVGSQQRSYWRCIFALVMFVTGGVVLEILANGI